MSRVTVSFELGDYLVLEHSTGNLRFAVWKLGTEVCWCRTKEQSEDIVRALSRDDATQIFLSEGPKL